MKVGDLVRYVGHAKFYEGRLAPLQKFLRTISMARPKFTILVLPVKAAMLPA